MVWIRLQISANVLDGLHHMINYVKAYDYANALAIHTQMISQG